MKKQATLFLVILLAFAVNLQAVSGVAEFQVSSFSCTPSEAAVTGVFSCTAQLQNTGDAAGSVSIATLYPDENDWLEDTNYPQASGTSVEPGQSTEVMFTGLRAIKSGNNGFSKIMLDEVTDTYVSDNNIKVNSVDVLVTSSSSASSSASGGSFDVTAEVTAGGNIDVTLTLSVLSGGCSLGSQSAQKSIAGLQDGNKQSRTWTVTQGTTGNCRYTVSAAATGTSGVASKSDSVSNSVTCTDCTDDDDSSSVAGGGASGGAAAGTNATEEEEEEETFASLLTGAAAKIAEGITEALSNIKAKLKEMASSGSLIYIVITVAVIAVVALLYVYKGGGRRPSARPAHFSSHRSNLENYGFRIKR